MRLINSSILILSILAFWGCDKQCYDIALQNDFNNTDYIKFPIFNKLLTKDTALARFRDGNGIIYNFIYNKGKMLKGFNQSKALKSYKGSIFGNTSDCQRESYVKQDAFLSKKIDSTGYVGITILRCNTIENAPNPCPDTVRFFVEDRFIGDTVINGINYSGVKALKQDGYGSYSLINLNDGVIYFELTSSGKKSWKIP